MYKLIYFQNYCKELRLSTEIDDLLSMTLIRMRLSLYRRRLFGEHIASRLIRTQNRELSLRCIAYNMHRTGLTRWKDKPIIPLEDWTKFRDKPYSLHSFPDDFEQMLTYLSVEDDLEKDQERKGIEKWNSTISS